MSSANFPARDAGLDLRFLRSVEAAIQARDIPRAIALAREGLADGLVHPLLLNLRAHGLAQDGRDDEAVADLRQALAMAPGDPVLLNAYGFVLTKQSKFKAAIDAFEEAIRRDPGYAEAYCNLGWAREALGDLSGSEASLDRAIALEPGYADALARLAEVVYRRGDFERALALADRALAADPKHYTARKTAARVAIDRSELDRADAAVADLLSDKDIPAAERVHANGLRGDILHARGRYGEAFEAYKAANDEDRALHARRFARPGAETAFSHAVWASDTFADAPRTDWAAAPQDSVGLGAKNHVFLTGFPRSGTTLLENVLASHPDVVSLEEKATLVEATRAFFTNDAGRERLRTLGADDAARHREIYGNRVRMFGPEPQGKVFIDKDPLGTVTLPVVAKLFPSAKILFALRDPRDVVLSCYRRTFLMNAAMFELTGLESCARYYDAVMRLGRIYREKLGLDWYDLRHETLVGDFEGETRRVCDFLGIPWDGKMAAFAEHAKTREIATPSATQVMKGLSSEGVGTWRNYREQLAPVLPVLAPWVEAFGYPAD